MFTITDEAVTHLDIGLHRSACRAALRDGQAIGEASWDPAHCQWYLTGHTEIMFRRLLGQDGWGSSPPLPAYVTKLLERDDPEIRAAAEKSQHTLGQKPKKPRTIHGAGRRIVLPDEPTP